MKDVVIISSYGLFHFFLPFHFLSWRVFYYLCFLLICLSLFLFPVRKEKKKLLSQYFYGISFPIKWTFSFSLVVHGLTAFIFLFAIRLLFGFSFPTLLPDDQLLLPLIFTLVFSSISEEIFYRGYMLCRLKRAGAPRVLSVIVSSLFFSLAHNSFVLQELVFYFASGVVLSILLLSKKSLITNYVVHLSYNLSVLFFPMLFQQ